MACSVVRAPIAPAQPSQLVNGRLPRQAIPLSYGIHWMVSPTETRFDGQVTIAVRLLAPTQTLLLHGANLEVSQVYAELAGQRVSADYAQLDSGGVARLTFGSRLPAGITTLHLTYSAPFDPSLRGLYAVEHGGHSYAFTQFEPDAARFAFPCFDEPEYKTPFTVAVTVPAGATAIANGVEAGRTALADGRVRIDFQSTKPLPTYLVAVAVGPFDVVTAPPIPASGPRARSLTLRGIAPKGQGDRLAFALARTPQIVEALEAYFTLPYPFEKLDVIAVPDFAAGAMENAGAITFRDYLLLLDPEGAPEHQKRAFAYVMAHELAHQWFGNLVTMRWWDDLWLNEAFATWMGYLTVDRLWPDQQAHLSMLASAHHAMHEDSLSSARMVRQPIASPHDIASAFDGITYSKGAAVLGMVERSVGSSAFRAGVVDYLKSRPFGSATAEDLVAALSAASGRDLSAVFSSFLDQSGVPALHVQVQCTAEAARLVWRQSRYRPVGTATSTGAQKRTWTMPLCVRIGTGDEVTSECREIAAESGEWPLPACPDWVMPNADAAGYMLWSLASADFAKLMTDGLHSLTVRERLALTRNLRAGLDAGTLNVADLLDALPALAVDEQRVVARAPMAILRLLHDPIASESTRSAVEGYARGLYAPVLQRLGMQERAGDTADQRMLRSDVMRFVATVGRHPAVRRTLAAMGRRHLHSAEDTHSGAAELLGLALTVAVQDGGDDIYEDVYRRLVQSVDPLERGRLLAALASVKDGRSARARQLVFDTALRANEVIPVLAHQLGALQTREATFEFLVKNWKQLTARLSKRQLSRIPMLTGEMCTAAHAERLRKHFGPLVQQMAGGPRGLATALEDNARCRAQVVALRQALDAYFDL